MCIDLTNILKELNGKQLGEKYCFSRNGEKFVATLGYDDYVDHGKRDIIIINQIDNKYSNVFKLKKGKYDCEDNIVSYYSDDINRFIEVTDFSDIVNEIIDWIDFVTL